MSMKTQRGSGSIALTNLDPGARWGGWSLPCSSPFVPPGKRLGTHCTGGWVGLRASLDKYGFLAPMGFKPWIVQPIVSYYTNYAILAINNYFSSRKPWFPIRPYPFQLQCF